MYDDAKYYTPPEVRKQIGHFLLQDAIVSNSKYLKTL